MKLLLLAIALGMTTTALSQQTDCGREPDSRWIDTTSSYHSRYGRVATLTADQMPCIIPYPTINHIPNPGRRQKWPSRIPNAWPSTNQKETKGKTKPMRYTPLPPCLTSPAVMPKPAFKRVNPSEQ